jgi:hypothetical protein
MAPQAGGSTARIWVPGAEIASSAAPICYGRAMEPNKTALERAFELARSGLYQNVEQVKRAISAEGYVRQQVDGRELSRQLRAIIVAARSA